jgi:hypothetical protein
VVNPKRWLVMGVWQIGAYRKGQNVKASKAMLTFVNKVGVSWHALSCEFNLHKAKLMPKTTMVAWEVSTMADWGFNSLWDQNLGQVGLVLRQHLGSPRKTLLGNLMLSWGETWCSPHSFGDNLGLSQGQLSVVFWDTLGWLRVVSKVTFCNWGTSNNGPWVSRPWTLGSPHFKLSPSLALTNRDLFSESSLDGFKSFSANPMCHGMHR